MEAILDEARELLLNDSEIVGLLGTPIQIGMPFSQMSSTTVINGRRQMRSEFSVEISGPIGNGVSRIVASNEGIGQLLFESNGKMYNVDLSSRGRMKSASPTKRSSRRVVVNIAAMTTTTLLKPKSLTRRRSKDACIT